MDEYLRSHIDIAPKAIVLVAILKQEEDSDLGDTSGTFGSRHEPGKPVKHTDKLIYSI